MVNTIRPVGHLLREWRQRRRLSQLALACDTEGSTRHLSFLETGRSLPSRDMILHLVERLNIPLRERNVLMVAAGYAPTFAMNIIRLWRLIAIGHWSQPTEPLRH
jgi:transcriptional regulator with XRE-family HTH domain